MMSDPTARRPGLPEFTVLMAMLAALVAFSTDTMLPAMAQISSELTPDTPNRAQWIISGFFAGLAIGTLFAGPFADAFGRKITILGGMGIYCIGAVLAWQSETLEGVVLARVLQGMGGAGPRVAILAVVRDLFAGREMARVVSLIMTVFVLVPAAAPLVGSWVIAWSSWREIFLVFILFALVMGGWFALRQPETLPVADRRPLRPALLWAGVKETLSLPIVRYTVVAQACAFSIILMMISTTQQVFEQFFDRGAQFPLWFALISLMSAISGIVNARIVGRLGMRSVVMVTFLIKTLLALCFAGLLALDLGAEALFPIYILWVWSAFMTAGFTIGNLNALGLEPLGHIAGVGGTVITSLSTFGAVLMVAPAGAAFDGTPLVQAVTLAGVSGLGALLVRRIMS